jgi:hypothetical protein
LTHKHKAHILAHIREEEGIMSQVTIYLDEQTDKKLRQAVEKSGLSKSQWISRLIKEKTTTEWPEAVRGMVGEWQDVPEQEEIRQSNTKDLPREEL